MYTLYGIHHDGTEEGHVECATLYDVFMHLREMLASEAADPQGPIFESFGISAVAQDMEIAQAAADATAEHLARGKAEVAAEPRADSRTHRACKPIPRLGGGGVAARKELLATMPVARAVMTEETRQAILAKALQARHKVRRRSQPSVPRLLK